MGLFSLLSRKDPAQPERVRIASPEFKANPYPFYARLRAEEPVYRVSMLQGETAWLVTRYDDVSMVLKDERFVKDPANALTPEQAAKRPWFRKMKLFKALQLNMLNQDPPNHTRLRALVNKAFTPRLVEQVRDRVQRAREFHDGLQGGIDLIRDYALPLPVTIIAEAGACQWRTGTSFNWSNAMIGITSI